MDTYRNSKDIFEEEFEKTQKVFLEFSKTLTSLGVNNQLHCNRIIYWDGPQDEVHYSFNLVFISRFRSLLYKFKGNRKIDYYLETHKFDSDCIITYMFDNFKMSEADYLYKNDRLRRALIEEQSKLTSSDKNRFEIRKRINKSASRPEQTTSRNRVEHYLAFADPNNSSQKMRKIPNRPSPPVGGALKPIMM